MHGMGMQLVCRTTFSSLSSSCSFSYFLTLLQNFSEKEKTVHANFFSEVRSVVWTVCLSPWYHNVSVVVTLHTATNLIRLGQSLLCRVNGTAKGLTKQPCLGGISLCCAKAVQPSLNNQNARMMASHYASGLHVDTPEAG